MRTMDSEFLVPGVRLGTFCVPEDEDRSGDGGSGMTLEGVPGLLSPAGDGWRLLLASPGDLSTDLWARPIEERELMWGEAPNLAISIFGGRLDGWSLTGDSLRSVWNGDWYVESPTHWVRPSDKARRGAGTT